MVLSIMVPHSPTISFEEVPPVPPTILMSDLLLTKKLLVQITKIDCQQPTKQTNKYIRLADQD